MRGTKVEPATHGMAAESHVALKYSLWEEELRKRIDLR